MRTAHVAVISLLAAACASHASRTVASPRSIQTQGSSLAVRGGSIWYRVVGGGTGTPLILLHGGPGMPSVYLKSLEALGDERLVVRYDQLGAGYSDVVKDTTLFNIGHFVAELDSLRQHLGLERVNIYGHSWGATLALEYYRAHPGHVVSLVLASPVLDQPAFFAHQRELLAGISDALPRMAQLQDAGQPYDTAAFRQGMKEYSKRYSQHTVVSADADTMRKRFNPAISEYMLGSGAFTATGTLKDYDATPFLRRIRVPTLYVVGDSDFVGPGIVRRDASLTPGARLVVIPGAAHMTMWDSPAANLAAIRSFLHDVDAR